MGNGGRVSVCDRQYIRKKKNMQEGEKCVSCFLGRGEWTI